MMLQMKKHRCLPLQIAGKKFTFPALVIFVMLHACIDKDLADISTDMLISQRFSIPIGTLNHQMNGYFESLDTAAAYYPDSVSFNDRIFPNPLPEIPFGSTSAFDFNLVNNPDVKVQQVEMVVTVSNGYPTGGIVNVYLLNGNPGVVIDSIQTALVILPGLTDGPGLVTAPSVTVYTLAMPGPFMSHLFRATHIRISGYLSTSRPDRPITLFYDNYGVSTAIGMRVFLEYFTE